MADRERERAAKKAEVEQQRRWRKERSVLLRAKLIVLRDSAEAEAFAATRT